MNSKLILIEGLPGSGKSTTAQIVYNILKEKGTNVELYCEGNYNHPADFDGVAYFNSENFNKLKHAHSTSEDILNKIKVELYNGYLIPYRKAIEEQQITFKEELFKDITKNHIYELPIELHTELMLKRWDDFVKSYVNKNKVVVFECCFIQNPITVSMIKNNCAKDATMSYIINLGNKIMPLEPVLIYVEQQDIKASFSKAIDERPNEWFEGFTDYYTNQGYGLANNLSGLEGVLQILEARRRLENEIYDSLQLVKYKIDNSAFNIDLIKKRINFIIETCL